MKALFIGGIKSGKSASAERYTLALNSALPPLYLATSEPFDDTMRDRIERHRLQRSERFFTVEEPLNLLERVQTAASPVLIECVTLWMNNMLHHGFAEEDIFAQVDRLLGLDKEIVFVLNDVGGGVIPDNALARAFVDISGNVAQRLGAGCDEVFHCVAGIATRIK
jgi:adenosylcobinamide kinase/adenosylcobinamide-phosphate guanylyltransferase